ncbi:MAG: glycosyltransferase family 4 protein [Desulfobacterales bacterium]|jgi:glycosyltransferase involved in cell wall biosynthesis|nr:glycosyltransferase family 4 protein [Desulfobacterales bacterium]
MKIGFYAPFKPLDHPNPSGDLVTASGLVEYLTACGHQVAAASSLRCRWIYWKPWLWPRVWWERQRATRRFGSGRCDLWFSYHSYYKAPDMLGPAVSRRLGVPYVLFQGIYSTRRRRQPITRPGFELNRSALLAAAHIFTNKRRDHVNLKRLVPEERITYIAPGLDPGRFAFDPQARCALRRTWGAGEDPVILSVAMFRPGVKADGLAWVIRTCGELARRGRRFVWVVAGDGKERSRLERLAREEIGARVHFAGRIPRGELYRYYSAADLFFFPGIREALGMVYLEAQSCGLPVVAFDNAGVPEAVQKDRTGLLAALEDGRALTAAVDRLLCDAGLRRQMGACAKAYVRERHDLGKNYARMDATLRRLAAAPACRKPTGNPAGQGPR